MAVEDRRLRILRWRLLVDDEFASVLVDVEPVLRQVNRQWCELVRYPCSVFVKPAPEDSSCVTAKADDIS